MLSLPTILEIILPWRPWPAVTTLGHLVQTLLHIGATQRTDALRIPPILGRDGGDGSAVVVLVHVLDDAREEPARRVAAECPRGVPVPDDLAHVGHVGEHGEAPHVFVWYVYCFAVHGEVDAAQEPQVEPRGRDDDVGVELLTAV